MVHWARDLLFNFYFFMENKLKERFYKLLKKDARLWDEKTKELNQTLLKSLIDNLDKGLLELFLADKELKEKFFAKIGNVFVLKQNELKFFIDESKLDNSYTQYQNKIGLRAGNKLLSERDEVVLDWPFKDCVLEGGMAKEDQKRNEIFFNQILAQDEIDRLFDAKAFANWTRHTAKGKEKVRELKRDKDGTIRENLIIKGNNLLALYSLKHQFAGKIKLIYIDPPYNTGGNANIFSYNNNFNHSTWLTFIKNRIEIAKNLLREDGFIAITIDHCELFYLGALVDEIFGRENRLGIISIVIKPEGRQFAKFFSTSNEFMLVYAKNINHGFFENVILDEKNKEKFDRTDKRGNYKNRRYINYNNIEISGKEINLDCWYPFYVSKDLKIISLDKKPGFIKILPIDNGVEKSWQTNKKTAQERIDNDDIICEKNKKGEPEIYFKARESQRYLTHWFDSKYNATHQGTRLLEKITQEKGFSYPKSLYAVLDTFKMMTSGNDIILDFFSGSGTTGHATLELNKKDGGQRNFILIEQLDEHIQVANKRIENIEGEFVYCEMAKLNEDAKEKILAAKSLAELEKLFDELYERYFLNYNVEVKNFAEKIIKEEGFKKLKLSEQKKMFVEMLDANQMYVNFSEREDKKVGLAKEDIALSEEFYQTK